MNEQMTKEEIIDENEKEWMKKEKLKFKKIFSKQVLFIFVVVSIFVIDVIILAFLFSSGKNVDFNNLNKETVAVSDNNKSASSTEELNQTICNVSGVDLRGEVVAYISPEDKDKDGKLIADKTSSENIIFSINEAEANSNIKAIILEIDSYGGSPLAGEEIANAIKQSTKPTVALIRSSATSAAYWASTGANVIFASTISDVGSIGVTSSYVDTSKKNLKDGYTYNSLSTGQFKDYGNLNKPLTEAERNLIMRDMNVIFEKFIKDISVNRNLDADKVRLMADGSSMPGEMALKNGLVDKIGGLSEVKQYLKDKIGEDVEVCW